MRLDIDFSPLRFDDSVPAAARRLYTRAQQIYSAEQVERGVDRLAVRLTANWQNYNPLLITLLPAGFVFGGMLMRRVVFPCQHMAVACDKRGVPQLEAAHAAAERRVALFAATVAAASEDVFEQWAQQADVAELAIFTLLGPASGADSGAQVGGAAICTEEADLFGSGLAVAGYGANLPGLYKPE